MPMPPTPAPRARETARRAATGRDREPGSAPESLTHPDPGGLPGDERAGERGAPRVGLRSRSINRSMTSGNSDARPQTMPCPIADLTSALANRPPEPARFPLSRVYETLRL